LTRASAERLVAGARRSLESTRSNIDDARDGMRPAHTLLLQAEIRSSSTWTNLDRLPAAGFRFHCVPAPFRGLGAFRFALTPFCDGDSLEALDEASHPAAHGVKAPRTSFESISVTVSVIVSRSTAPL